MRVSRRAVLGGLAAMGPAAASAKARSLVSGGPGVAASTTRVATSAERNLAPGPFEPTWESLKQSKAPEWFRDAKFGIWAHWGPQCVPEQGDWYARNMYIEGTRQNKYHVAHYGHPAKFGFKDIDHLWKAENWQPDGLMDLYVKAGAKYFMSLANHHDNFDTYDSTYHEWNAVRIGPKRDIVAGWAAAARKRNLRFGVSNHSAHAWHWLQPAFGYDTEGPSAKVRYDGSTERGQGKGSWWNGFDPQDLYVGPSIVLPEGMTSPAEVQEWHAKHDGVWSEVPPERYPGFTNSWFLRCQQLVDKYNPDLLYFDDTELPLQQTGLDIVAHFYNQNMRRNGGKLQACVFGKKFSAEHKGAAMLDMERTRSGAILADAWQTDTCIGDWHYSQEVFEQHRYKSARTVIQMLVDVVSKNGNLLLSIPLKGDGTTDSDERQILSDLASWFTANGEAIYGTRPFKIFGEGPQDATSPGTLREGKQRENTAEDIRFTVKGGRLYAIALGWPDSGKLRVKSLARGAEVFPGEVEKVELLGADGALRFVRAGDALEIALPVQRPNEFAYALRITPANLNMLRGA